MNSGKVGQFRYKTHVDENVHNTYTWHTRDGALQRLLPPWQQITLLHKSGGIAPGGKVLLKMGLGPFSMLWESHHIEEQPEVMFHDIQAQGPFAYFSHTHSFSGIGNQTRIDDTLDYRLPGHRFLPKAVTAYAENEFTRMFRYRETMLKHDLALHKRYSGQKLRILISGASGVLGRKLVPMLTTGGHEVYRLVRRPIRDNKTEFFWDPEKGLIDIGSTPQLDAVIHLAGEYIGLKRWSSEGQARVMNSRRNGTQLLAEALVRLPQRPKVFLSASAIGIYGDCGSDWVTETRPIGQGFVPDVCREWEKPTEVAEQAGIRTILMRLGIGLTATGGALPHLLSTRPLGLFRHFGNGRHFISWVSAEDMIAAMLHCLHTESIRGPVNIAAPDPSTNTEVMQTLAAATKSRFLPSIPAGLLRWCYGPMADELILSSCRISSAKLQSTGFTYSFPSLHQVITHELGL